jgi:hypothetical protein
MIGRSAFVIRAAATLLAALVPASAALAAAPAGAPAAAPANGAGVAALPWHDATEEWGLAAPLRGMMSHAAACGDVTGDGRLSLYVGGFADRPAAEYAPAAGPPANVLLIGEAGRFRDAAQPPLAFLARTSGAAFVDLDNDGLLDLVVSNNSKAKGLRVANGIFRNTGGGKFVDMPDPDGFGRIMGGRTVGVLDYDGDGLLDLFVGEDKPAGGSTRLFRNRGGFRFEDTSEKAGLPAVLHGLGVATTDLNADGRPDLFVCGDNRLFLSAADGTYKEAAATPFRYEWVNREGTPCGVVFADMNRDGLPDAVIVDHSQPARLHLFINEGLQGGAPVFRETTREAGLAYEFPSWDSLHRHLKHAHVEVADVDNDGWPDIVVAATWDAGGVDQPFVCRNLGGKSPRFSVPPPQKATGYFPAGPVADFDRDGRPDIFLASWLPAVPSRLLLNRHPPRRWLGVRVRGRTMNRMGIGAVVSVYEAGGLGRPEALVGSREIGIADGFCTGHEAVVHFGLADAATCDVEVVLPWGKGTVRQTGVAADRVIEIAEPEAGGAPQASPPAPAGARARDVSRGSRDAGVDAQSRSAGDEAPPAAAPLVIVADEWKPMDALAEFLANTAGYRVEKVGKDALPADLAARPAVFMYIHSKMDADTEKALVDYAAGGGRLIILHHGIASARVANPLWLRMTGIGILPRNDPKAPWRVVGNTTHTLVNLAPGHHITSHKVAYDREAEYTSPDDAARSGKRQAIDLPKTEVFLNQQFTDGDAKTVLFGSACTDPETGESFMQDRGGWLKAWEKGWVIYLQPGHAESDFRNGAFLQIIWNTLTWTPPAP